MQGHPDVIDYLNTLLTGELAARDQYFVHSRMYEDWGFTKLYERINHEMEEEAGHADALMRRILMLEGTPRMRPDDWMSAPRSLRCSKRSASRVQGPRRAVQRHRAVRAAQGLRQPRHPARSAQRHRRRSHLLAGKAVGADQVHRSRELPAIAHLMPPL